MAPAGCATAKSYISATALSQTNTDYKSIYTQQIQSYTAAMCAQGWSPDVLSAYASQAADAFATATAYALSHYYTYACTCCKGNSVAYSSVKASIQAVAAAQAFAMSQAIAAVTDCDGNVLSYGSGIAQVIKKLVHYWLTSMNICVCMWLLVAWAYGGYGKAICLIPSRASQQ